ncbi:MAG TPA: FMN-binding glutamate synthase family protein, partial [Alphaproteobacteria bacterium]|nr:FMN-binding glutamate synthase family protein [Alphaproteobacteria bacterium]
MASDFALEMLSAAALLLVFCIGVGLLVAAILFALDITQTRSAVRRNYPLIGRFRYLFEHLGTFFRQYFYAADREEMPFNREQRSWIYRAAKNLDNTASFGSTQDIHKPGTVLFANSAFPVLERDALPTTPLVIGPDTDNPYAPESIFNVSAMSFGAISKVAVEALSRGARLANCWLNTGEGGLSSYHLAGGCDIVFQIGTAKYGVRDASGQLSDARLRELADMPQVRMFELKLSQGAKAGKGGILPASKVTSEIAVIRGILPGVASISPNRHEEIGSPGELLDLIGHIRAVSGKPVGIKAVF